MMLVAAPEASTWIPFPKSRMALKHSFSTTGLQHDLCILNRVPFWDVHLKMDMCPSKTKISECEPESFQFLKSLLARINVRLLPETVEPIFRHQHHRHPIIPGVTHTLFIAPASYTYHSTLFSCRTVKGADLYGLPRATELPYGLLLKRRAGLSSAGLTLRSRPRSIPGLNA